MVIEAAILDLPPGVIAMLEAATDRVSSKVDGTCTWVVKIGVRIVLTETIKVVAITVGRGTVIATTVIDVIAVVVVVVGRRGIVVVVAYERSVGTAAGCLKHG